MNLIHPTAARVILAFAALALASGIVRAADNERTLITSERLEMQGFGDRNHFRFTGTVEVQGNNLLIHCDSLTVIAMREGNEEATIGQLGAIERIVALGNVTIHQAGRTAYAGKAEVDPRAGTVTLSDQPRIVDNDVEVEGYQFVLHRGQKKFVSVPDPNAPADRPSRSVVRLGVLPDLGFDQDASGDAIAEAAAEAGVTDPAAPRQPSVPELKPESGDE